MSVSAAEAKQEETGLGNYFIANYPPFSFWTPKHLPAAERALATGWREWAQAKASGYGSADSEGTVPLGLYLHIPFCRKRCKFCYFRVYTDKNAKDVEVYLQALTKEVELYSQVPAVRDRVLNYVYFGGGTPSYLSAGQLRSLVAALNRHISWKQADEVTFECEPGTLQQPKLEALKEIGVTRLSLGIENFDDRILEENGRAHRSPEIWKAYQWARDLGFDQINIDLIAGMVGESDDNWCDCVKKTIDLHAESVTIYQMELPFNTVFSKELKVLGQDGGMGTIADWPTKRRWVEYAFEELAKAGYEPSSGYTMVRDKARTRFVYRDALWHGADLLGTGVASFGHVGGVHVQNVDDWEHYIDVLQEGRLPLHRALPVKPRECLIRELILQLKTGRLEVDYFTSKFDVNILDEFADAFHTHRDAGFLTWTPGEVRLTGAGLLQVDRLLPAFFLPEHRGARYT